MDIPVCQSCGMPLNQDKAGGMNADGSRSREYCSNCYDRGTWMMPDLTVDQMQKRIGGLLKQRGASDDAQRDAVAGITKLKRWMRR